MTRGQAGNRIRAGKEEVAPCSAITPTTSFRACSWRNSRTNCSEPLPAAEDFIRLAAAKGLDIHDLIRMAESGMSGRQIAEAIISADAQGNGEALSRPLESYDRH
jgi:hypothetical protein